MTDDEKITNIDMHLNQLSENARKIEEMKFRLECLKIMSSLKYVGTDGQFTNFPPEEIVNHAKDLFNFLKGE